MVVSEKRMAGKSSSYRLCLCFSSEAIVKNNIHNCEENQVLWYLIDPYKTIEEEEVETKINIKSSFIGPKEAPIYFGCGSVQSTIFLIGGGSSWETSMFDPQISYSCVFSFDPFSSSPSSSNQWVSGPHLNEPKKPLVFVSPPSFGDKRVVFAIGSDPTKFIEMLSCSPSTGEWTWTVIPPPLEHPFLYHRFKMVFRAGFALIDGNRKLLICSLQGLIIFDIDTNKWDTNIDDVLSTYASILDYGTYYCQIPVIDNVWYVVDKALHNKVFGFDLHNLTWSEVHNLGIQEKYWTHSLVQIGDRSMALICVKECLNPPEWKVSCTVFQVQKGSDGALYAYNLSKTPTYVGNGVSLLHSIVLDTDQDTACGSSRVLKKSRIESVEDSMQEC